MTSVAAHENTKPLGKVSGYLALLLVVLVVALPLGLARVHSGGLVAPIIVHQINNLLPGILLYAVLTGALPGA